MRRIHLVLLFVVTLLIGLGWFGWWAFGRSPQDQLMARQTAFLLAVEERDWDDVKAMLTDDYMDDYGHDRDTAVEDARQVLGGFLALTIKPQIVQMQAVPDLGMVKIKLRIEGKGLGFSDAVISQVNSIEQPWFFHWHKKGRWPWDWKVVQIHNDGLHVPQL